MSFLTLEDINTILYSNQNFYWHTIDTSILTTENTAKIDFCTVTKNPTGYSVMVDSSNWTKGYYILDKNNNLILPSTNYSDGALIITTDEIGIKICLYMGVESYNTLSRFIYVLVNDSVTATLKELKNGLNVDIKDLSNNTVSTVSEQLNVGFNEIEYNGSECGFYLVNSLKTDFKFNCNQELINGKINTVQLGTDTDYKPNGDLIGDYTPKISVFYGDETIPVSWNSQLNDYTFDIDLSNREKETDIVLTVFVDNNEVLNQTSTDIRLHTRFENIDSITKLNTLFQNGGIGRLDANLVLTNDLTVSNDVYLLGNHHNINMADNKFIISENKTFKCEQTGFSNGENTIQQKVGSKVELTECSFTGCTGLGSVIDCQIDRTSLTNPTDFTTNLEKCVFDSCDMMILHGGKLSVTNCVVNGANTKVDNPNYPFFLYQTDGTARILQSEFNFIPDTDIDEDIEFNSCIFVCGETAEINGYNHTELQKNNLTQFLEVQRNTSKIDVTYYYPTIEDYITLRSNNGFCHAVSNVDYVFKTNVTPERR